MTLSQLQSRLSDILNIQHTAKLYQFVECINFSKSTENYEGEGGHLEIVFVKLGPCHPDNFKASKSDIHNIQNTA